MSSSQPGAPPITACASVHHSPVELLDSQASHQANQTLSDDEKNSFFLLFLVFFFFFLVIFDVIR